MVRPHVSIVSGSRPLLWVVPMTAAELLAGLQSIPEARRVPAVAPIEAAVLLAGVEVAITAAVPDRTFRARWRERHGGGATPLLLLADDGASVGCVTVLGPIDGGGALRTVEAGSLADLLRRIAGRSRLDAVRELAAELDRLEQAARETATGGS